MSVGNNDEAPETGARSRILLTREDVLALLTYDPITGEFHWKKRGHGIEDGSRAGYVNKRGYVEIMLGKVHYRAHRLAWLVVHGSWPSQMIDHINGVRDDNRIDNLRDVCNSLNQQNKRAAGSNNRSSGLLGVRWCAQKQKWRGVINVDGCARHLGYFEEPLDAHRAYMDAKVRLHPGYAPS